MAVLMAAQFGEQSLALVPNQSQSNNRSDLLTYPQAARFELGEAQLCTRAQQGEAGTFETPTPHLDRLCALMRGKTVLLFLGTLCSLGLQNPLAGNAMM